MSYSAKKSLQNNIDIIKLVLENENKKLNREQIEKIKSFSGWNMKVVLFDPNNDSEWETASSTDKQLKPLVKELYDTLEWYFPKKEIQPIINSIKNACLTSYFTPSVIPSTFFKVLSEFTTIESLYECSAGAGVFITEALKVFPNLKGIIAYEKDVLTSKILKGSLLIDIPGSCIINKPFEESDNIENEEYEIITSNIPFGAMPVFDLSFPSEITSRIHCYFFAKGLTKIKNKGVLAYLVSNAFLDTSSNKPVREHLFKNADFISLTVMPDNLMQETAGTMAPSHFLVVRKNTSKTELSEEEKLLIESKYVKNEFGTFSINSYIEKYEKEIIIGTPKAGKNQYGKSAREIVWEGGDINWIERRFSEILEKDFQKRFLVKPIGIWKQMSGQPTFKPYTEEQITEGFKSFKEKKEEEEEEENNKQQQCLLQKPLIERAIDNLKKITGEFPLTFYDIPTTLIQFIPVHQIDAIIGSTEHWEILDRLQKIIESTPGTYEQDSIDADEKVVYLHYFLGDCDWYITEKDNSSNQEQMFCFANLGDDQNAEWGYVSFQELNKNNVELDFFWKPRKFKDRFLTSGDTDKEKISKLLSGELSPKDYYIEEVSIIKSDETITDIPSIPIPSFNDLVFGKVPFKPGMIVKQKVTKENLFEDRMEIVRVDSISPPIVVPLMLSKKEKEVMEKYLEIRNVYLELEKEENQ